jgi:hypothetical protein
LTANSCRSAIDHFTEVHGEDSFDGMRTSQAVCRMSLLLGATMVLAAPAAVFVLAKQGIEAAWLAGAVGSLMSMVAITLIVRSMAPRRRDRT